jgi:hypothetical protein
VTDVRPVPMLAAFVVLLGPAISRAPAPQTPPEAPTTAAEIVVRCVDTAGKPVTEAEVHLVTSVTRPDRSRSHDVAGPLPCDAEGRLTVKLTAPPGDAAPRVSWWLYARVADRLVGSASLIDPKGRWRHPDVTDITMVRSRTLRGRVRVGEGIDPATVTVALAIVCPCEVPGPGFPFLSPKDRLLGGRFVSPLATDGSFELRDVPALAWLSLRVDAPSLPPLWWRNAPQVTTRVATGWPTLPDLLELELSRPTASVSGRVLTPSGEPLANTKVELVTGRYAHVPWRFQATTDAAGEFAWRELPGGLLHLRVVSDAGVLRPSALALRAAAEVTGLEVKLEPGVDVRGVLADGDTGEPLVEAKVHAVGADEHALPLGTATTDTTGTFVLRLPEGAVELEIVPHRDTHRWLRTPPRLDVRVGAPELQRLRYELFPHR